MATNSFYEEIGGRETLNKVHKIFYDKIYKDPWIGLYFANIPQEHIENQQSDFMAQIMGGPQMYLGNQPIPTHKHMFITLELFELRTKYLTESLIEVGLSEEQIQRWLRIDQAFKSGIVKEKVEDCKKRYNTDEILDFRKVS